MKKTKYSVEYIKSFLEDKYKCEIVLNPVVEGMESQVYAFNYDNHDYIIRINPNIEGFKKDEYAYKHFNSDLIPIPRIIEVGKFSSDYYCISERIKGITLEDSSEAVVVNLIGDIDKLWSNISSIDISSSSGYGVFSSETGNAPFSSWREYLLDILNKEKYDWEMIKKSDYIDSAVIDKTINMFKELIEFVPNERKLRHGDYGSNNLLVAENELKITGVIDWDLSSYGDPMYEVASANFWSDWLLCMKKTADYWNELFKIFPNYQEIISCYQLHLGLVEIYENVLDRDLDTINYVQNICYKVLTQKPRYKELETARLLLRKEIEADKIILWNEFFSNYEDSKFFRFDKLKNFEEFLEYYNTGEYVRYIICLKDTNEVIGSINLHKYDALKDEVKIGYFIFPKHRGHGYVKEALEELINYTFNTLNINKIIGSVVSENTISSKVLINLGFKLISKQKEVKIDNHKYITQYYFLTKK